LGLNFQAGCITNLAVLLPGANYRKSYHLLHKIIKRVFMKSYWALGLKWEKISPLILGVIIFAGIFSIIPDSFGGGIPDELCFDENLEEVACDDIDCIIAEITVYGITIYFIIDIDFNVSFSLSVSNHGITCRQSFVEFI